MESTGTESAAPTSTADIAANVIETAEAADTASSDTGESSSTRIDTTNAVEEKPAAAVPATPTQAELSAAAKFLLKQGHKLKKDDGRDVWLPAKTVEGMLDRYVEDHRTTWSGERTTLETRAKELESHLNTLRASVAGDPKAFLAELAGIDDRYKAFLEPPAAPRQPAAPTGEMPQPDYQLPDGTRTFSLEGVQQRLIPWLTQAITTQLEGTLDARLKPWQEREQHAKEREASDKAMGEIRERATSQMDEAQTWPLFGKLAEDGSLSEFQQSVLAELQKDSEEAKTAGHQPKLTLEGAYIRVASKRFTEDDATKRERLLKEIQGAPKSPALSRQTTDTSRTAGPRSTQEITRQVVNKLESA